MTNRTQGIIDKLASAESFEDVSWMLKSGVITNYTESVIDSKMKANYEAQGGAGLSPRVERIPVGRTCEWCDKVAGIYQYPDVPRDVWRRHDRCNCMIQYTPRKGRTEVLTGSGRTWAESDPETLLERQTTNLNFMQSQQVPQKTQLAMAAENAGVKPRKVSELAEPLTEEEVCAKLADWDNAGGSCASLAYAYAGNKGGLDVLDFRGGASREFFSYKHVGADIATLPGVNGKVVEMTDDLEAVKELLSDADKAKEYILRSGAHCAVVKWDDSIYSWTYLELQSPPTVIKIGGETQKDYWSMLDDMDLLERWKCTRTGPERISSLVPVDELAESEEFKELMAYINTAADEQKRGIPNGYK